jgi:hypothetical protein
MPDRRSWRRVRSISGRVHAGGSSVAMACCDAQRGEQIAVLARRRGSGGVLGQVEFGLLGAVGGARGAMSMAARASSNELLGQRLDVACSCRRPCSGRGRRRRRPDAAGSVGPVRRCPRACAGPPAPRWRTVARTAHGRRADLRAWRGCGGLARGVEHPLVVGQHHGAGALGALVGAQQAPRLPGRGSRCAGRRCAPAPAADGRRARGVAAVVDAHAAVVAHRALHLAEVLHAHSGSGLQVRRAPPRTWPAPGGARCRGCAWPPSWSPSVQELVLLSRDSKRRPFKAVAWVWPMALSTVPLRLGSRTRAGSATTP